MHNSPDRRKFIFRRAARRRQRNPNFQTRTVSNLSPRHERHAAPAQILAARALLEFRALGVFSAHVNRQPNINPPLSTPLGCGDNAC
jgi:hypothetical protein